MAISAKTVRSQLALVRPCLRSRNLERVRKGQNMIGELMGARYKGQVMVKSHDFPNYEAAWIIPKDERRQGVILYLHGGGYIYGGLEYAKGFGTTLAVKCGVRVFCPAYRLAPEHRCPAAVEDALEAYRYLLDKGYTPAHITLCGESAGGGLCYSLCQRLKELDLLQPCGIIAVSPWTDMTSSGSSYAENRENDPTMTLEFIRYCAEQTTDDPEDPIASPLLGDLTGLPPSLIFVGADEVLLSDSTDLHEKLKKSGCKSTLHVAAERWHGYLLYDLQEDQKDFTRLGKFLDHHMCPENKLRWVRLDNAAKIYPAARRQNWSNVFRLSVTLKEEVDVPVLQSALDVTARRFPSVAARLRKGAFWYYLQQLEQAPPVTEENSYPLTRMTRQEMRRCALRVLVYRRRIAVEFFHSLTDGTGGLIFLKTLLAEYLQQKHGIRIPAEKGVLGRLDEPSQEELEDSFQRYAGPVNASRKETDAFRLQGTQEPDGFLHLTCFELPVKAVLEKAHAHGVTVTAFLCAAMMLALQQLQSQIVPNRKRRKAIKVLLPVNLRPLFPSKSLRNFALYTIPEIDPRLGDYSFEEICNVVSHWMALDVIDKKMAKMIAVNVNSERIWPVKVMPLFLKNLVMKAIFDTVGERKSSLCLSNLGAVQLPQVMVPYVDRFDFILGVQATAPYNCGVASFGDKLFVNFIRNTKESDLELQFFKVLQSLDLPVQVQSNRPEE